MPRVGEFIRWAVDAYDPDEMKSLAQLAAIAAELKRSNRKRAAALDRALASVEITFAQLNHPSAA